MEDGRKGDSKGGRWKEGNSSWEMEERGIVQLEDGSKEWNNVVARDRRKGIVVGRWKDGNSSWEMEGRDYL